MPVSVHVGLVCVWLSRLSSHPLRLIRTWNNQQILAKPKISTGKKIDATMDKVRLGLFFRDAEVTKENLEKASKLVEDVSLTFFYGHVWHDPGCSAVWNGRRTNGSRIESFNSIFVITTGRGLGPPEPPQGVRGAGAHHAAQHQKGARRGFHALICLMRDVVFLTKSTP